MTEGIPAQFDHCMRVYALMERESSIEEFEPTESTADYNERHQDAPIAEGMKGRRRVWEGHTTRIFNNLELSTPYYTSVLNHLKRMGCVEQLRRGGGSATSKWLLIREPTIDLYEAKGSEHINPATLKGRVAETERNIRDLNRKLDIVLTHLGVKF